MIYMTNPDVSKTNWYMNRKQRKKMFLFYNAVLLLLQYPIHGKLDGFIIANFIVFVIRVFSNSQCGESRSLSLKVHALSLFE